jgi:23S rRNA U2552 (ribose-2'-O)-methylase RlmE/FtsJ
MMKRNLETPESHPGSFRDNNGVVFFRDGVLLRGVADAYSADYKQLFESGLYKTLTDKRLLVKHEDVTVAEESYFKVLKPDFIPFITYPSEWSFNMLKDAALLTLRVHKYALQHNMVLKDASVYNVQFAKGRPIFIDLLSFEKYQENAPWQAYGQFCRHFLAPLALMKYSDVSLNKLFITYLDGVPLNLAASLLPFKAKLRIGLYLHLFLHSKASSKYNDKRIESSKFKGVSKQSLLNLTDNLIDTVSALKWQPEGTEWGDYYDKSTEEGYLTSKKEIIASWLDQRRFESVLDLGANDGAFSRLASARADRVYSFDIDPACVDNNYKSVRRDKIENIFPLLSDFANPTPAYGWANKERDALFDRVKPDLVMSLAIIHHLRITSGIPLTKQAVMFASLCSHMIIEFVPKSDDKVVTLLQNREDIFDDYSESSFEEIFQEHFEILDKQTVKTTDRILYYLKRI